MHELQRSIKINLQSRVVPRAVGAPPRLDLEQQLKRHSLKALLVQPTSRHKRQEGKQGPIKFTW